jgi:hypothetical protein
VETIAEDYGGWVKSKLATQLGRAATDMALNPAGPWTSLAGIELQASRCAVGRERNIDIDHRMEDAPSTCSTTETRR